MSITQPQALKQLLAHNEQEAMSRRAAERDKQREIDRLSDKAFWEATARHWHDRAAFLEMTVKGLRETYSAAVQEMEAQNIERAHWLKDAEQHRTDCISAERRSDALGDILSALKQGYQIEEFPGRATWWTMDTDTLAQIAKDAREWQDRESEKPPVYMGKGEGEPFTMGGQEFKPEDQPVEDIPFIVWEWGYRPATLNPYDVVEAKLANGLVAAGIAANVVWDAEEGNAVTAYRVLKFARPDHACIPCSTDNGPCDDPATCHIGSQASCDQFAEPTKAEVEAEELIGLANHIHSSMDGLPEEWEPWAVEIHERIRQVAHRLNQK